MSDLASTQLWAPLCGEGAVIAVPDVWIENEEGAAVLVATKLGLPLVRVTVWAGRQT
jgi:hypothetical protein